MKWGIAGYGRIARKFIEGLLYIGHDVEAIASVSNHALVPSQFKAYDNYDDLMDDENVQIIYVSTTHNTHAQLSIQALQAGKHVLCEKPMSISADDVSSMIEAARSNQRLLMEALWSRYLPAYQKVMETVNSGRLGRIVQLDASFGFKMNPEDPKERLINPSLAAGAIWDVGIYPISLALDVYDEEPSEIRVNAELSALGVEDRVVMQLAFGSHRFAQLSCAINLQTFNQAVITGTEGIIVMSDFWKCEQYKMITSKGEEDHSYPMQSNGLCHEAQECARLIESGRIESPLMTWAHSLQLATVMDHAILLART